MKTKLCYYSNNDNHLALDPELKVFILGNKGAQLFEINSLNHKLIQVPKFLVVPTNLCRLYGKDPDTAKSYLIDIIKKAVLYFDKCLVSVRSGAPYSMPGLMETILNVGLTVNNWEYWYDNLQDTAYDCLFRLRKMFAEIYLGVHIHTQFNCNDPKSSLSAIKKEYGSYKTPETLDFGSQLYYTSLAIMESWNNEKAIKYRQAQGISDSGTAIVYQQMVYGNSPGGYTGVMFSSNMEMPYTDAIKGEFLKESQGEDLVSGIRTPEKLTAIPATLYLKLHDIAKLLEEKYNTIQDIEFTIQNNTIYILQTRAAKIPPLSKIELAHRNLTHKNKVRIGQLTLNDFLVDTKTIRPHISQKYITGLPACNGVITGKMTFDVDSCDDEHILCTSYTTTEMLSGLLKCKGIITLVGGSTCHAAILARTLSKPAVVGIGGEIQHNILYATNGITVCQDQYVTLDATQGRIYHGALKIYENKNLINKMNDLWDSYVENISDVVYHPFILEDKFWAPNIMLGTDWYYYPYSLVEEKLNSLITKSKIYVTPDHMFSDFYIQLFGNRYLQKIVNDFNEWCMKKYNALFFLLSHGKTVSYNDILKKGLNHE